jgi:hypothetical protein
MINSKSLDALKTVFLSFPSAYPTNGLIAVLLNLLIPEGLHRPILLSPPSSSHTLMTMIKTSRAWVSEAREKNCVCHAARCADAVAFRTCHYKVHYTLGFACESRSINDVDQIARRQSKHMWVGQCTSHSGATEM